MTNIYRKNESGKARPPRDIWCAPIVDRIIANPELGLCGLTHEAATIFVKSCELTDMPKEWLQAKRAMDRDCVESIALLLRNALEAVQSELEDPTPPLRVVSGGEG